MKKYNAMGTTENQPHSGCLLKLTDVAKCHIVHTACKNHCTPFSKIQNLVGLKVDKIFDTSSTVQATINVLPGRSLFLPSSIGMHIWPGLASIKGIYSNNGQRSFGQTKPIFTLAMIVAVFLSHSIQMKNTLTNVWF
jgi:hypothetical protein